MHHAPSAAARAAGSGTERDDDAGPVRAEPEQEPLPRIREMSLDREPGATPLADVAVGRSVVEQQLVVEQPACAEQTPSSLRPSDRPRTASRSVAAVAPAVPEPSRMPGAGRCSIRPLTSRCAAVDGDVGHHAPVEIAAAPSRDSRAAADARPRARAA